MPKKIGLTLVVLILALGAMGAAYGLWSEMVWLRVKWFETGEVDVGMSLHRVWDVESKNVATCKATLIPFGEQPPSDGLNAVLIEVDNAYPSYECHVTWDITNLGSIPVHFKVETEGNMPEGVVDFSACRPLEEVQLHAGRTYFCHMVLHFTNDTEGMEENRTVANGNAYALALDIMAHQYNEEPPPQP